MSAVELADALCDVLEAASPRSRTLVMLPLLRESVAAAWQALKTNRPELVAEYVGITPIDVDQEFDRVFDTLARLAAGGGHEADQSKACDEFIFNLLVFTSGEERPDGDEEEEAAIDDPVMAVWQAAAVLHDLFEDLRGGHKQHDGFPFLMAEMIVDWPALDPHRTAQIDAAMHRLRDRQ